MTELPLVRGDTDGAAGDLDGTRVFGVGCDGGETANGRLLFITPCCLFPTLSRIFGPDEAGGSCGF